MTHTHSRYVYQAGGSLPVTAPSYVKRQADEVFYESLKAGQLCYVLNARQMGKSSLRLRVMDRLRAEGVNSGVIDMTIIGSQQITIEQWYASVLQNIVVNFRLSVNLRNWWRERSHLSPVQRFGDFLKTVLLIEVQQPIVIFIDEIDSVLGLDFPIDDFFALIRTCYNRRSENPIYQRLTFALLGVATPSDLIRDRSRTPFNIGMAINLQGFRLSEALPLLPGLQGIVEQPEAMLRHILAWTNGQPFLTQKICQLVREAWQEGTIAIPKDQEEAWLENLVRSRIINHWELQDEPEHLRTIAHRLLHDEKKAGRLLGLYQQILTTSRSIPTDNSPEQTELRLSGLVVNEKGYLQVSNTIYKAVFDVHWVEQQLMNLRPYGLNLREWLKSDGLDNSRLLQGNALREAESWAKGKRISDQDYQFLAASRLLEQMEQQQALEAARTREVEARLVQEHKNSKLQRFLLILVSGALMLTTGVGLFAYFQYLSAKISEIKALTRSSEALFASNHQFDALIEALRAKQQGRRVRILDPLTQNQVATALQKAVYGAVEINRLSDNQKFVFSVTFSPDGQRIATAGEDGKIRLYGLNGQLLSTIENEFGVMDVKFSSDGQFLLATTQAGDVKSWDVNEKLLWRWKAQPDSKELFLIREIVLSPDNQWIAVSCEDNTIKLLQSRTGRLIRTLEGHQDIVWGVTFSPDGQQIASASQDKTVKLWYLNGQLITTLTGHSDRVNAVRFSPDGKQLISGDLQGMMNIWDAQSVKLVKTVNAHKLAIEDLSFSPDGQQFVSTSTDGTIKFWNREGELLQTLHHGETVFKAEFSHDGQWLASAGADTLVKLWRLKNSAVTTLRGHQERVMYLRFSPNGDQLASSSWDNTVKLWSRDGRLLTTFRGHSVSVNSVAFHPDGEKMASSDSNGRILLWKSDGTVLNELSMLDPNQRNDPKERTKFIEISTLDFSLDGQFLLMGNLDRKEAQLQKLDGTLVTTLWGHQSGITQVRFSPDGQRLATASLDGTVKIWNKEGQLLTTLTGHQDGAVWSVALSHDGQWIATSGDDKTVKLWRSDNGQLMQTFEGHTEKIYSVDFSPDGQILASTGRDRTIKFWKLDGTLLTSLPAHQAVIMGIAFSPDGKLLGSGAWDNTVRLWNWQKLTSMERIEQLGCEWLHDYLTINPDPSLCDQSDEGTR